MKTRNLPYGYSMEKGIIVVNEEEAKNICRIFEMRKNGIGVYALGKKLYEEQIPFFSDTRDKAIKKASAILYKAVYKGNEKFPAIIDSQTFSIVQQMKSKPLFKKKARIITETSDEEYIFMLTDKAKELSRNAEELIVNEMIAGNQVRNMIIDLAAEL